MEERSTAVVRVTPGPGTWNRAREVTSVPGSAAHLAETTEPLGDSLALQGRGLLLPKAAVAVPELTVGGHLVETNPLSMPFQRQRRPATPLAAELRTGRPPEIGQAGKYAMSQKRADQ